MNVVVMEKDSSLRSEAYCPSCQALAAVRRKSVRTWPTQSLPGVNVQRSESLINFLAKGIRVPGLAYYKRGVGYDLSLDVKEIPLPIVITDLINQFSITTMHWLVMVPISMPFVIGATIDGTP
jgi:hypothetical protein